MTTSSGENENGTVNKLFPLLALPLVTGAILIAIGGIYYSFIDPSF